MKKQKITVADVARAAGVSPVTASLALNRNPKVLEATIKLVSETADRLGYKTLHERRIQQNQSKDGSNVWCLIFPYCIKQYRYTKLDLQIIDLLETAAQENNAVLQISRLNEDLDLQSTVDVMKFSHIFIKSHSNISKIRTLKQRGCRSVVLFGFYDNVADGLQISYNPRRAVELIVEKALEIGCGEIVQIDLNSQKEQSFLHLENCELLSRFAEKNGIKRHYVSGSQEDVVRDVRALVKASAGKVALVGFRNSGTGVEQECMDAILQSGLKSGEEVECFICEYDRLEMKRQGRYYVDLLGKEIVNQAVCFAESDASPVSGLFLLEPTLIQYQ